MDSVCQVRRVFEIAWAGRQARRDDSLPDLALPKQRLHRHLPSRNRWFCVCNLPSPEDDRMVRRARSIDFDDLLTEQIHAPHQQRPAGEVVGTFFLHRALGCRAVVVLTARIRELQAPDPGELLHRHGSNIASVLVNLKARAPETKNRNEDSPQHATGYL